MVDAVGGNRGFGVWRGRRKVHFDLDGVDGAVAGWWNKGEAVLVTNELRDLAINFLDGFGAIREENAAARGIRERTKPRIGLVEILLELLKLPGAPFLSIAEGATDGYAEHANIAGLQTKLDGLGSVGGIRVHTRGEKDDGFLAGNDGEPIENSVKAGR